MTDAVNGLYARQSRIARIVAIHVTATSSKEMNQHEEFLEHSRNLHTPCGHRILSGLRLHLILQKKETNDN